MADGHTHIVSVLFLLWLGHWAAAVWPKWPLSAAYSLQGTFQEQSRDKIVDKNLSDKI